MPIQIIKTKYENLTDSILRIWPNNYLLGCHDRIWSPHISHESLVPQ